MLYGFSEDHFLYELDCGLAGCVFSAIHLSQECATQAADAAKQDVPGEQGAISKGTKYAQHNRAVQCRPCTMPKDKRTWQEAEEGR